MARVGMNPAKLKKSTYKPARVTVATIVHIPNFVGYYEHRFPVLKACLQSIIENTTEEYDLLVLDNGSCEEVRAYLDQLLDERMVDFLLHSQVNLGKLSALRLIFESAPGQLVAYSDDDFYFFSGWLRAHLRVLESFPNVGVVSGYAAPGLFEPDRISANLKFAESNPGARLEQGQFLDKSWVRDWAVSTGRDPEKVVAEAKQLPQMKLHYKGVEALATAHHAQFLAPRKVLLEVLPQDWSERLMGGMLDMDREIDRKGYLRLTTPIRTTQHLGNVIDSRIAQSIPEIEKFVSKKTVKVPGSGGLLQRIVTWPPVRAVLLGIYSRLFHLIHPE